MRKRTSRKLVLRGRPQERQTAFFEATEKYVAFGGARGGGKSWALRRKAVLMCLRYPGLSVLFVRRTYAELRENHIRPLCAELGDAAVYVDTHKTFTFPNGSRIRMGYCDNESDVLRYQGQEYDVIGIDEATQLTEYQFQTFKACLRGVNPFPKRMYLTCNPGGVGHGWVKRLFIDCEYRDGERREDYRFIPASVYDNRILLRHDPDYLNRLRSLPDALRDAWLYGKWDAFAGQFFPEFSLSLHTVAPFVPDGSYTRVCAIDYGLDMFAAVFVALAADGRAYVYDEIYQSGLVVSEAAKLLREKSKDLVQVIAPADLWSRQKDSGKSISELFAENGVYLSRIYPERVQGWLCLKEWLKPVPGADGKTDARMKICRCCTNLIRTLPQLMYDEKNPGDAALKPHEITHAPDALRYFASARTFYRPPKTETKKQVKLTERFGEGVRAPKKRRKSTMEPIE